MLHRISLKVLYIFLLLCKYTWELWVSCDSWTYQFMWSKSLLITTEFTTVTCTFLRPFSHRDIKRPFL